MNNKNCCKTSFTTFLAFELKRSISNTCVLETTSTQREDNDTGGYNNDFILI